MLWLLTLAGLTAALALAVIAVPLAHYTADRGQVLDPTTMAVVTRDADLATPATLTLRWSTVRTFRFGIGVSGLVTAVRAHPGRTVGCGSVVVKVDGREVIGLCTPHPLWRDVSAVTTGSDFDGVVRALAAMGYLPSRATPSTAAFAAGVKRFQRDHGLTPTGVLAPAQVVWLPGPVVPTAVAVQVGERAAAGEELLTVGERLLSATGAGSAPAGTHPKRVFNLEGSGERFPVTPEGSLADPEAFGATARRLSAGQGPDLPSEAPGFVRLATPVTAAAVPTAAVISGPSGTCVQTVVGGVRTTVPVVVVGSTIDGVLVSGQLRPGTQVALAADAGASC